MRRLPNNNGSAEVLILDMSNNQNLEVCSESRIERMKKLLSSPLTKKKSSSHGKMFGIALETLVQRESSQVPFIVVRICQYIEKHGMNHEGIFRISGNARLVEKLKSAFDHTGDAPLESEGDVASAGALLKLYLRELPEPVIPATVQTAFLEAVRANAQDKEKCVEMLKCLVCHLPDENHAVLKYLIHFLHRIAQLEEQNRMSASSLGIVFGPNLFRVSDDFSGLKDQAVTNQIAMTFIKNYAAIFEETSIITDEKVRYQNMKSITEPLSVLIPPMDSTVLGFQGHENSETLEKPVPVLMVDSFDLTMQNSNEEYGKEPVTNLAKTIATPPRRKRKERKFSGEETAILRSNSEERPIQDEVDDLSLSSAAGERLRRCSSHEEMRKMADEMDDNNASQQTEKYESRRHKQSAEVVGVKLTLSAGGRVVLATQNQDLSPHPPKPKRRELENCSTQSSSSSSSSTLRGNSHQFDIYKDSSSGTETTSGDFHELQRSAERLAPMQYAQPSRSRYSASKLSRFRKSQSLDTEPSSDESHSKAYDASEPRPLSSYWSLSQNEEIPMETRTVIDSDKTRLEERFQPLKPQSKENYRRRSSRPRVLDSRRGSDFTFDAPTPSPPATTASTQQHPLQHLAQENSTSSNSSCSTNAGSSQGMEEDQQWPTEMFTSCDSEEIPHLDLNNLHTHGDGNEPLLSEHRFSWPLSKPTHEETALLSPSAPFLRKTTSLQFDPSLPPSPPVEQDDLMKSVIKDEETVSSSLKQLTKKMHSLKKKIKQFEESFEYEHGFRPSHAEKMNYPEVKKMLLDFNKARKEFRQIKEDSYTGDSTLANKELSAFPRSVYLNGEDTIANCGPSVEDSLSKAQRYLAENRRQNNRSEDFEDMTKEETQDEKIAIQKALLQFESLHGRPTTKYDRDLMRPLYERYRKVKRIARAGNLGPSSLTPATTIKGKDILIGTELQPILEHEAMDFTSPQHRQSAEENQKVPDLSEDIVDEPETIPEEEEEFLEPVKIVETESKKLEFGQSSNLHELPLSDLIQQLQQARIEKRRLKKSVREFEDEFQKQTGRRAQREDRTPVETLYIDYKHIKARLKLLEALVSKHEHHHII